MERGRKQFEEMVVDCSMHAVQRREAAKFFCCVPPLFGSGSAASRFAEHFHGGQYSLVSFLIAVLLLTLPLCPAICKSKGTCPPCPVESALVFIIKLVHAVHNNNDDDANNNNSNLLCLLVW